MSCCGVGDAERPTPTYPATALPRSNNTAGIDYMLYKNIGYSDRAAMGAAVAGALIDALFGGPSPEMVFEEKESFELSEMLRDWDFTMVIRTTFTALLAEGSDIAVIDIEAPLSRDEIKESTDSLAATGLDAIADLQIKKLGLRTNERGFSVYSEGTVEIISLETGKVIASDVVVFDYDYARRRFEDLEISYLTANPEARGTDLDLDSLFVFPVATEGYRVFREDEGRLLKRELKLAAHEMSRLFLEYLGFRERDQNWEEQYRKSPAGLVMARGPGEG